VNTNGLGTGLAGKGGVSGKFCPKPSEDPVLEGEKLC